MLFLNKEQEQNFAKVLKKEKIYDINSRKVGDLNKFKLFGNFEQLREENLDGK